MSLVKPRTLYGLLAGLLLIFIAASLLTGQGDFVDPVLLLAVIVTVAAAAATVLVRRKRDRYGSVRRASADDDAAVPGSQFLPDEGTPLGATPEAHAEISPHDLPVDHPGRGRAERVAEPEEPGAAPTTRGDVEPGG